MSEKDADDYVPNDNDEFDDSDSEDELAVENDLPEDVAEAARTAHADLLPKKSNERYREMYDIFIKWKTAKKISVITKDVLMAYFSELAQKYKPPTLWSIFSMLKTVIKIEHNIDIGIYAPLISFIKRKNDGYKAKKSKTLTAEQVQTFLNTAPDEIWLATKVVSIFGLYGGLRLGEITNIRLADVEDHNKLLVVNIPETKTKKAKSFTIGPPYYELVQKYRSLRPEVPELTRYFLNYQSGKCTRRVMGRNKIAVMPKEIAKFLELPNVELYTGHCFRRSSASILANAGASSSRIMRHGGWESEKVDKSYVVESLRFKNGTAKLLTSEMTANSENTSPAKQRRLNASTTSSPKSFNSGSVEYLMSSNGNSNEGTGDSLDDAAVVTMSPDVIRISKNLPLTLNLTNCTNFEIHFKD